MFAEVDDGVAFLFKVSVLRLLIVIDKSEINVRIGCRIDSSDVPRGDRGHRNKLIPRACGVSERLVSSRIGAEFANGYLEHGIGIVPVVVKHLSVDLHGRGRFGGWDKNLLDFLALRKLDGSIRDIHPRLRAEGSLELIHIAVACGNLLVVVLEELALQLVGGYVCELIEGLLMLDKLDLEVRLGQREVEYVAFGRPSRYDAVVPESHELLPLAP